MRPPRPFTNLDDLRSILKPGTPERRQLDTEGNYVNHDLLSGPLPFKDGAFDAIALFHCLEHFHAMDGLSLLKECRRVLKPNASMLVSVPNASYFREVNPEDRNENWERLFGVVDPNNPIPTWMRAALFFSDHRMVFSEDSLWCFFREAGFEADNIHLGKCPVEEVNALLNRHQESLIMHAIK